MNICWTEAEKTIVKAALKDLLVAGKHPKASWAQMLHHAQKSLDRRRRRKPRCLVPNVSISKVTQEKTWGSSRDIIVEALRELGLVPDSQMRWEPLPHRQGLRVPPPTDPDNNNEAGNNPQATREPAHTPKGKEPDELQRLMTAMEAMEAERDMARAQRKAVQKQLAQCEMDAEELRRRVKALVLERDKALASHAAMEKQLAQSETLARLQALERDVWAIHEFLTSHGYKPHVAQVRRAA